MHEVSFYGDSLVCVQKSTNILFDPHSLNSRVGNQATPNRVDTERETDNHRQDDGEAAKRTKLSMIQFQGYLGLTQAMESRKIALTHQF